VTDHGDGRYAVTFRAPSAGEYAVDVLVDETTDNDRKVSTRIRGAPFAVAFESAWTRAHTQGAPPPIPSGRMLAWLGADGSLRVWRI
jgi:hypothetical protein